MAVALNLKDAFIQLAEGRRVATNVTYSTWVRMYDNGGKYELRNQDGEVATMLSLESHHLYDWGTTHSLSSIQLQALVKAAINSYESANYAQKESMTNIDKTFFVVEFLENNKLSLIQSKEDKLDNKNMLFTYEHVQDVVRNFLGEYSYNPDRSHLDIEKISHDFVEKYVTELEE